MKKAIFFCIAICCTQLTQAQDNSGYHVTKTFHIKSEGWWDYIAADPASNKLYVSHGGQVNILDKNTGDSVGVIPNTTGVHGIAFNQEAGKGYTSNGKLNNITIFNLKTAEILGQVATGQNPDAIMYDVYSKKVITCNGRSNDLTFIDAATGTVTATVAVGGKPETAVSNNAGKIYVNIEDKNEIAVIDIAAAKVIARWLLAPAEGPTGLEIDNETHRLFVGCEKMLVVVNAETGAIVAKPVIGDGCDGVAFDAQRKLIFASCGDGVLSIIKEESADKFVSYKNVPTKKGARTIAVDISTHAVYMPTADFQPQAEGAKGRPQMLPGSFQVVVAEK